jgi:histidine triad (HIT) family protein
MSDCPFCKIAAGEAPARIVHSDDEVVAFHDNKPQAPTHVLVIPREHITSADELTPAQDGLWGRLLHVAQSVVHENGDADAGYRLLTNVGRNGGQTVDHLHVHLLGGRQLTWPPG